MAIFTTKLIVNMIILYMRFLVVFPQETLLEEQKSVLSQLHKERQSVAEERTKLNVALTVQREDAENAAVRLAQVK